MSIFLLVISAISFLGIMGEQTDNGKLCFTVAFIVSVVGAIVLKLI